MNYSAVTAFQFLIKKNFNKNEKMKTNRALYLIFTYIFIIYAEIV